MSMCHTLMYGSSERPLIPLSHTVMQTQYNGEYARTVGTRSGIARPGMAEYGSCHINLSNYLMLNRHNKLECTKLILSPSQQL